MKKLLYICLCLFMVSGCSLFQHEGEPIELTPQEVIDKLQDDKQNSFLLYLTTEDCYSCNEYEQVIEDLEDESHFDIYYINVDLREDDKKVKSALEELSVTIGDYSTLPMTYYFYQGSLLPENKKEGFIEKKEFRKWLKELRLIK